MQAKIFALTPIWRKDRTDITRFESFEEIEEIIADVVKKYDNVTAIKNAIKMGTCTASEKEVT